ncbi:MAG: ammonia permease [Elusimicrobia bacterium RIFOXYB12_FULL_50_12]|nr:MAG: ammonia permease [Elusimicrobia bacterium RIFOXYA12_FULL_49_49]OGS14675.1 MAG: ammonia permease [Elusimicrobia bacterium RIFOXYA2_FULL_47_53]OGS25673.1 MAG: ammonia permease [Elusimicrobia bacterium RIFOXYB12_FULL_50_12]OGS31766.1 MAG: ammonia permease [Elusimicrobia bacterium RIFOXYB2_FULL_46_23]
MFTRERITKALKYTMFSLLCAAVYLAVPHLFADQPAAPVEAAAVVAAVPAAAPAAPQFTQEIADTVMNGKIALDTVWVLITAFLVFFMNLGFAMVETGLCRSKNAVNILAKNFIVFGISSLAFYILGWGLMFGDGNGFMGLNGLLFSAGADNSPAMGSAYQGVYGSISWTGVPFWAKFFFQMVFAGTAATIVSGAVAERIKFGAFIAFSFIIVGLMYPITGHWIWGGGWLQKLGMWDFAGSTVVHSVGGWSALAGIILLGPRIGKYRSDGSVNPIPGHSMALATLGVLVLWFGWFGFNPGSTMAAAFSDISRIVVTTNSAAAAAALSATLVAWALLGKPDLSMILNGCLAGLVAITAPCAFVTVPASIVIGLIAGVLVVLSVLFFDMIKIDDPVGALSVHLANGVFGTLAVGLFAKDSVMPNTTGNGLFYGGGFKLLIAQATGVAVVAVFTFVVAFAAWYLIKKVIGMRVTREEEIGGLDVGEHGMEAYPDFQGFLTK